MAALNRNATWANLLKKRQFIERWLKISHRIQWQRQSWLGEAGSEILIQKCFLIHPSHTSLAVCFIHFCVCVCVSTPAFSFPTPNAENSCLWQISSLQASSSNTEKCCSLVFTLFGLIPVPKALGKKLLGGFTWVCHWPHQWQQGAGSHVRNIGHLCSHTSKYKGEGQPLNRGDSWELMRTTTPTSKEQVQLQWFLTQRQDFPSGSDGKASAYNMGDPGSFPGLGRSQAEGNGNPLQYSCLENPMDRGAWEATVHGVAKSRTQLSNFTLTLNFQNTCEASTSNSQNHSRELHSRHHTPANTNM